MSETLEQTFFDEPPAEAPPTPLRSVPMPLATQPGVWRSSPVIEWLILDAWRLGSISELTAELAEKLIEHGVPLYRLFLMVPLLHPLYVGSGYIWRRGVDGVEEAFGEHGARETDDYRQNPLRYIIDEGYWAIRRRVGDSYVRGEFALVDNIVDEGGTDYISLALEFTDGGRAAISFTSDGPDGFSAETLVELNNLLPVIARLVERAALEKTVTNILDAYVGHTAGDRILKGQITRGSRDTIYAGIWFCDIRGFTRLSDRMQRDDVIALLNSFFETMAEPVHDNGGEVMKFIGDAMLAVFPTVEGEDPAVVCGRVLAAAKAAVAGMDHLNEERAMFGQGPIGYGLACHIGEVAYGNIGAANRLDFTVIGPAVNYAQRLEQLCKAVPERPILSEEFVRLSKRPVEKLGDFTLGSLPGEHAVYGVAETDGSAP